MQLDPDRKVVVGGTWSDRFHDSLAHDTVAADCVPQRGQEIITVANAMDRGLTPCVRCFPEVTSNE